jgi:4'-phosphopantetheinyl transferase
LARYWVLKDAYTKAIGIGLRRGFRTFAVNLGGADTRLRDPDAERAWRFEECRIGHHIVVLASDADRRPGEPSIRLLDAALLLLGALGCCSARRWSLRTMP